MTNSLDCIVPDWPAPPRVRALITTRSGGVSTGKYAQLNLGERVGDDLAAVIENRRRLRALLPAEPRWLEQVHGTRVVEAEAVSGVTYADAAVARAPGTVCVVTIADCLPVLLCDRAASRVAIAHAGWRGLSAGVLERTIDALGHPDQLMAYLGPAIGPQAFEVGDDVFNAFVSAQPDAASAFVPLRAGKWLADLFRLARQRLARAGVGAVHGGGLCTFTDRDRFFSYRRDNATGRMAALVWLAP